VLTMNCTRAKRNNQQPIQALLRGGFVKCVHCERNLLVTRRARSGLVRYVCRRGPAFVSSSPCQGIGAINAGALDRVVWERVSEVLKDPDVLRRALEKYLEGGEEQRADEQATLKRLDELLDNLRRRKSALSAAIETAQDGDTVRELTESLDRINAQMRAATRERESAAQTLHASTASLSRLDRLQQWVETSRSGVECMGYEEKRQVLHLLGVQVVVRHKEGKGVGWSGEERFDLRFCPEHIALLTGSRAR